MLLCRHHIFQRTDCPLPTFLFVFSYALLCSHAVVWNSSQLSFPCSDRLSLITTVGPFWAPQKSRPPRPADWKKGGANITASPSILVTLLIFCSGRNTAQVCDLYPASSNYSVRLVSFRTVSISACSWPSQHCCFFRKFHPPLVIVHPRPGSSRLSGKNLRMTGHFFWLVA